MTALNYKNKQEKSIERSLTILYIYIDINSKLNYIVGRTLKLAVMNQKTSSNPKRAVLCP